VRLVRIRTPHNSLSVIPPHGDPSAYATAFVQTSETIREAFPISMQGQREAFPEAPIRSRRPVTRGVLREAHRRTKEQGSQALRPRTSVQTIQAISSRAIRWAAASIARGCRNGNIFRRFSDSGDGE